MLFSGRRSIFVFLATTYLGVQGAGSHRRELKHMLKGILPALALTGSAAGPMPETTTADGVVAWDRNRKSVSSEGGKPALVPDSTGRARVCASGSDNWQAPTTH